MARLIDEIEYVCLVTVFLILATIIYGYLKIFRPEELEDLETFGEGY